MIKYNEDGIKTVEAGIIQATAFINAYDYGADYAMQELIQNEIKYVLSQLVSGELTCGDY